MYTLHVSCCSGHLDNTLGLAERLLRCSVQLRNVVLTCQQMTRLRAILLVTEFDKSPTWR